MRLGPILGMAVALAACGGDDVARFCDAESHAHTSAVADGTRLQRWIRAHARSQEGRAIAEQLDALAPGDRTWVLREAAARHWLLHCALAEAWNVGAKADGYSRDLAGLCAMSPPIDANLFRASDDDDRMAQVRAWVETRGASEELKALVGRVEEAAPRDRGMLVRSAMQSEPAVVEETCGIADALDAPGAF